jgi:hypothetical protein
MNFLTIVTIGFLLLEASNVIALYFHPTTKYANAVGVFKAWEKSKADPDVHKFVKYLVNWVAGTKLIFILLLIVILATGSDQTKILTGVVMVISIASFFWRLFPLIKQMDHDGQIEPAGYSKGLWFMIAGMILVFAAGTVIALFN